MNNQEVLREIIWKKENIKSKFYEINISGMQRSVDRRYLDSLVNETIIILNNLIVLKNKSQCRHCKGFYEIDNGIEEVKLLIEKLTTVLYNNYLKDAVEKKEESSNYAFIDFYN